MSERRKKNPASSGKLAGSKECGVPKASGMLVYLTLLILSLCACCGQAPSDAHECRYYTACEVNFECNVGVKHCTCQQAEHFPPQNDGLCRQECTCPFGQVEVCRCL